MVESESTEQLKERAKQLFDEGKYDECIEVCTEVIDKSDVTEEDKAEAYYNRGISKYRQGKYEEALVDHDKAIDLNPQYAEAYNNRGNTKADLQRYEEVLADYDKAIELDPQYANAYFNRGKTKHKQGRYEEAIKDYDKALELNLQDTDAYFNRGNMKASLQKYEEAIKDYDKVIELDPKDAEAYNNRGYIKAILERYEEALSDYDKAIELDPQYAEAYSNRGEVKTDIQNEHEEAIKDYDKAIELDPQYADVYYLRGAVKHTLKRYKEAIKDYDKAIELNPQYAEAYYYKGLLLLTNKNHDVSKILEGIDDVNSALQNGISDIDMDDIISDSDTIKDIFLVFKNVLDILNELKVTKNNKNYLSHTTDLSVLKQLLPILPSQRAESIFRLYHIVYSNDPTEGDILFKTLGVEDEKESLTYVMIASFSSGDSSEKLDILPLWSTYGDNTKGISLLFKTEDIASDEQRHIGTSRKNSNISKQNIRDADGSILRKVPQRNTNNIRSTDDSPLLKPMLYKVHYTDVKAHQTKNNNKKERKIDGYLKDIKESLEKIKPKKENKQQEEIYKKTLELLSGLRYLIKDKSYEYENEYRLVCFPPFDSIQYDEKDPENDAINRMYVEEDIIAKLDSVIVGAKVPPAKVLEIKYLLKRCDKTKDRKIEVMPSSIPYR